MQLSIYTQNRKQELLQPPEDTETTSEMLPREQTDNCNTAAQPWGCTQAVSLLFAPLQNDGPKIIIQVPYQIIRGIYIYL